MGSSAKAVVCIVTPGTRGANNGNWRTAVRWGSMLRDRYRVILQNEWDGRPVDALVALHARRSAASVRAYRDHSAQAPLAVVLTGTDLYRDLPAGDPDAAYSLDVAGRIVVLHEDAPRLLAPRWHRKAQVMFQSALPLAHAAHARRPLAGVAVGHLREEKDPRTLFAAMRLLPAELALTLRHVGAPLDESLARMARELARDDPRYRYAGALPHGLARAAIKSADVLVHPSVVEGGANVIVEAVCSATPVIASRISGNVGMLGAGYSGYFEAGDASALAARLVQAATDRAYIRVLGRECRGRRALFTPQAERRALGRLLAEMLA
jgi:putative glycosyltransferase (TIGR04348 family)